MKSLRSAVAVIPLVVTLLAGCSSPSPPAADLGLGEGGLLKELRAVEAERRDLLAAARKAVVGDDEPLWDRRLPQSGRLLELRDHRRELVREGLMRGAVERSETITEAALAAFLAEMAETPLPGALWSPSSATCPDLVADALLFDLAEAILADDRAAYASSLARVARSYECHSLFDAYLTNSALLAAYRRALERFDGIERLTARRALLSSLANVFVLAQDATKSFGPTRLHRFLEAERRALGEVFSLPHSPVRLAGLWLFHPPSSRMVRISDFCEALPAGPSDPGAGDAHACISGSATLDALLDPARLGTGACPLLDMLSEHFDPELGYLCQRNACADPGSGIPGIELMHQTGRTPHDLPIETLRGMHCPNGSTGSGVNTGLVGVLNRLGDVGSCITTALLEESGFGRLECVADIARRDRSPSFVGPPERNETCGDPLAQDAPPGLEGVPGCEAGMDTPACKVALVSLYVQNQLDSWILAASDGQPAPDAAVQARLRRLWDGLNDVGTTPGETGVAITDDGRRTEIEIGEEDAETLSLPELAIKLANAVFGYLGSFLEDDELREAAELSEARLDEPAGDPEGPDDGGDEYCDPTVGDCGDCSPGAARRAALLECLGLSAEESVDELPGGGFTDPPPWDDPVDAAWVACLAIPAQQEAAERGSLACAAELNCGDGVLPVQGPQGCHCPSEGGGPVGRVNACAWTDFEFCARPVAGPNGQCFCADPLSLIVGLPEGPTPDPERLQSLVGCEAPRRLAEWVDQELPLYGASREECEALGELDR